MRFLYKLLQIYLKLIHGKSLAQPEIFQGRGAFEELGHFDKLFVRNTRIKYPTGKTFGAFPPRYY